MAKYLGRPICYPFQSIFVFLYYLGVKGQEQFYELLEPMV